MTTHSLPIADRICEIGCKHTLGFAEEVASRVPGRSYRYIKEFELFRYAFSDGSVFLAGENSEFFCTERAVHSVWDIEVYDEYCHVLTEYNL